MSRSPSTIKINPITSCRCSAWPNNLCSSPNYLRPKMPLSQVWLHSLVATAPGFLPRILPSAVLASAPALVHTVARPNLNKARASVKQGALHKKGDVSWQRGQTGLCAPERLTACVGARRPGCVNVVCMCQSDPVSINRQVFSGLSELL